MSAQGDFNFHDPLSADPNNDPDRCLPCGHLGCHEWQESWTSF
jgi:hypothetical protein